MTIELRVLGQGVAVALAVIALYGLARRPSRETAEVTLFLVAFATTVFFDVDAPVTVFALVALGATAQPYLLVRITDHFRPVRRWFERTMLAGLVYCWVLNLSFVAFVFRFQGTPATNPVPPALLSLPQTLYLLAGIAYAAWVFITGALGSSGMRRARLRLAAAAAVTTVLAMTALTAATFGTIDELGRASQPRVVLDLFYVTIAATGLMYFAAFAPPPWLRRLWRLGELHRYLEASAASAIGERGRETLDALLDAGRRATGAIGGVIATAEPSGELIIRESGTSGEAEGELRGTVAAAWRDRRPTVGSDSIAVPIGTGGRDFGVVAVTFRRRPLFAEDDVAVLELMADRAAIALANDELFREQRLLAERTRVLEEQERTRVQGELARVDDELRVARDIQHALLPADVPEIAGWRIASHYQPARAVGGDFYDYFTLADGSLALVAGDASGKGIPAALLMAATRSVLRATSARSSSPGRILAEVNDVLCRAMPPNMFVTCLIVALDPRTGHARYANAGHLPAYAHGDGQVVQLRARGMPLGLMPDMEYEEQATQIQRGETVLLYSDGVVEAHDPQGRLFGFPRLRDLLALAGGRDTIRVVLDDLREFTTGEREQEDDITLLTVERAGLGG